ncbi:cytochrome c oxidase assembly protein [Aeromicrobium sp. Sec7.5]|uniref:cytochrome c oxidase assembly protein n=1 Tax=Aeromicrobium sp. Sec7.5 TaxID=3121276 RepID=UPI002FE4AB6B
MTYADITGLPLADGRLWTNLVSFATDVEVGRYLGASALIAFVVAIGTTIMQSTAGSAILAVLGLAGLWPIALNGHAAGSLNHDIAVTSQAIHLVGISVWVGGLVVLMASAQLLQHDLPVVVSRYSKIAVWCFAAVALSGVASSWLRVGSWSDLASGYGAILTAKVVALILLGCAGMLHRRRSISRLHERDRGAFRRLAVGEIVVMSVAMGLGVALGRIAPPESASNRALTTRESLLGFTLPGPLDWPGWIATWRVDLLWVPVAAIAIGSYLAAVRRLRRRGDSWPIGRTVAWVVGWLLLTWATSGSPGVYGKALFSMHMAQHMTIATAVPTFLVLGAPVTLLLRATRPRKDGSYGLREWTLLVVHSRYTAVIGHPIVAAGLFIVSLAAFYYSGMFELSMRSHTAHIVMVIHFLITGYLFANSVVGVDPGQLRPPYVMRLLLLMLVFAYHALFSVSLMASTTILAGDWFELVRPLWAEPAAADQYLGASMGWALGDYPLGVMAGALIWQWVRADRAEQRRFDRQAVRDGGAEMAAYNAYLQRLAQHHGRERDR